MFSGLGADIPAFFSPSLMKDLPQELLSKIFIACLPPPDKIDQCIRDSSSPPLLLCQICSSWRTVAIKTPQLWTHLRVRVGHLTEPPDSLKSLNQRNLVEGELVKLWGSRQGAVPSSISFEWRKGMHFYSEESDPAFLGGILSHPAVVSCQLLAAIGSRHGVVDLIMERLINDEFPNLEVLAVSGPSIYGPGAHELPAPQSEGAVTKSVPNLKRIYVGTHPLNVLVHPVVWPAIHWEKITHLALTHYDTDIDQWHSLLRECTSLTHLTATLSMEVDGTQFHERPRQPLLRRDSLQEIILEISFADTSIIFIGFIFPSVIKLRLSFGLLDEELTDLNSTHALLTSTPNVQELHTQYLFPLEENHCLRNFLAGKDCSNLDTSTEDCHELEASYPPLSTILPSLLILVVDCIGEAVDDNAMPDNFCIILQSRWLSYGWPSSAADSGRSILFVIDSEHTNLDPNAPLFKAASLHINEVGYSFHPEARIKPGRQWKWKTMNGHDLKYGWDRCSAWLE